MITIIWIFYDISKTSAMYDNLIEEDKVKLQELGMKHENLQEELDIRLNGGKEEDLGDDQLYGEAARLSEAEWKAAARSS